MAISIKRTVTFFLALSLTALATADHSPQHERHELMEDVRDAAKPVGDMLRGKIDYDADAMMQSLQTWHDVAAVYGDLFPDGTETGEDTKALPTIWEDREGFDEALANWVAATDAAIAAAPQTLDAAKPTVGPIFKTCKGCHDKYRAEDE